MPDGQPDAAVIDAMVRDGLQALTGTDLKKSFGLFFTTDDVVGIKVNPVGPGLISTRLEIVDAVIDWLTENGLPRKNIVIWDRFDYMLTDAGFTAERYPGSPDHRPPDHGRGRPGGQDPRTTANGWPRTGPTSASRTSTRTSIYWADVEGPKDLGYLNQHVFNGKYSYFGKLLTKTLTKFINIPVFKNTGNAISMATKNIGYGAVCNTNRLHQPLFLDVCVEVPAFAPVRDKMVLNITDSLRAQYDGGPGPNAKFAYLDNSLYFATDPFALDMHCHNVLVEKRKSMGVTGQRESSLHGIPALRGEARPGPDRARQDQGRPSGRQG